MVEAKSGGVQSVERAFDVLELMAAAGGEVGLSELAQSSGLPIATIHRLTRTLAARGYVRQLPSRRYALGPGLIRLGDSATRLLGSWARPHLAVLAEKTGETSNMAMLDSPMVVYVAQVPSAHSMRMFTEVGRRVLPHCTGVGKAILCQLPDDEVRRIVGQTGLPAQTTKSITDVDALLSELATIRARGYAIDDGEQEIGVRCFAAPVPGAPTPTAVSVSGPDVRVTADSDARMVPVLRQAAADLSAQMSGAV
ncbi:IclR family transcriptional regulator [Rhodococcus sp. D2-41]|uniref:IclR family transcriptional regulator n=1 Tax=Speluncibacter jeojiensis TaxID=2710754 RepID=UPI00240F8B23|nr:IclR family transcriptional regulator [Rhodococcus sp. D2-41]MDG3010128.1 IclR family transcriptional regulator [Rhodococcus sp. D2-41]